MRSERNTWLALVALSLAVVVSNSFGRFAYGLILPAMQSDLAWNYTAAGWMNTANAIGYIIGAAGTLATVERVRPPVLMSAGLVSTALAILFTGMTDNFVWLTVWRTVAGIAGAFVFIAGSRIAAQQFANDSGKNAVAVAVFFGGGGVGMIVSGTSLPMLFAAFGPTAWPTAWLSLGAVALAICLAALPAAFALAPKGPSAQPTGSLGGFAAMPLRPMMPQLVGYTLLALGYVVHLTFLVAWMTTLAFDPGHVAITWSIAGVAMIASPFFWRPITATRRGGLPLAAANTAYAIGAALPLVFPTPAGIFISAVFFGLGLFAGPSAITIFVRRNLPATVWGAGVALFTLIFAVAQAIGPVAAGFLSDATGSLDAGLTAAAVILFAAAAVAALQRPLAVAEPMGEKAQNA